jgi:carboxyl-terminal processing protease
MSPTRRALRVVAGVAALGVAYGAGVLTGVVGADADGSHRRSVVDEAADRINSNAASPESRAELERAAVQGMLAALGDRWSSYLPAADYASFQDVLDGRYSGVGLWVRRDADGVVRVTSVQADSPAESAGVLPGDELVTINGSDVRGRTVADVVTVLRGAPGTEVEIGLVRSGEQRTVRMKRVALESSDVSVRKLSDSVVLIRVSAFTRGVGRQVRTAAAQAARDHVGGIVLDLRDDPGGLLDEAVEVASVFLDGGIVASYERRGASPRTLPVLGHGDTATPLAVLVDSATASAAEVVAAALQDRKRAVVVGSRTFGKGSVQEPARLSDGSALELTVGRYLTPSGTALDGVGIEPDIEVPSGSVPRTAEQRAVEVLVGLLADSGASGRG